eukprot:TRINITY_DN1535_c0_g2_i2.p2 TRINITY_DN1535_c0_g2~~TRINITY_DN1535_c0_g2_i2.p2  ORF type:complete len:110 (+),score=0.99 TRINITY_DN1535_c0_g2_i2:92-421(+)
MGGCKEFLCKECSFAYDKGQFCQFCFQLYLKDTAEFSTLDGKEWAQCEEFNQCGRWAHVNCLCREYKKMRTEIVSENFKYICCDCGEISGKRKMGGNKKDCSVGKYKLT